MSDSPLPDKSEVPTTPRLSDLITLWLVDKNFPIAVSTPDEWDGSIYIDVINRPSAWIADIHNTTTGVILRDKRSDITGRLYPEDPNFFDKLEAHIKQRLDENFPPIQPVGQ